MSRSGRRAAAKARFRRCRCGVTSGSLTAQLPSDRAFDKSSTSLHLQPRKAGDQTGKGTEAKALASKQAEAGAQPCRSSSARASAAAVLTLRARKGDGGSRHTRKGGRLEKFNLTPTQAILYFDSLAPRETVSLRFRLRAKYPVRAETFRSRAYEYYDPEVSSMARPIQLEVRKH